MGVFISHSAEDVKVVRLLFDLLSQGIGIPTHTLFCTSIPGQIPPGADFRAEIKQRLATAWLLLPIVSESFSASRFCMFELGASWVGSKPIIPVLVPPITYADVAPILQDTQAVRIESESDLTLLRAEVSGLLQIQPKSMRVWKARVNKFLTNLRPLIPPRQVWLYVLRSIRTEGLHEIIGCFQIHRVTNRPNVIKVAGRAYWARPGLSLRGEWVSQEAVENTERILFNYVLKSPPDIHLPGPAVHEGIINLSRTNLTPMRGDMCFSGYVHDLFEWRDNTPRMYAERVNETWGAIVEEIEAHGMEIYTQLSSRLGAP